jgi:hypothetical protein
VRVREDVDGAVACGPENDLLEFQLWLPPEYTSDFRTLADPT